MLKKVYLLLSIILLLLQGTVLYAQVPKAENGILDLRNYISKDNPTIPLNGEWEFYWNDFVSIDDSIHQFNDYIPVPSAWNFQNIEGTETGAKGYATYRLKILLPDSTQYYAMSARAISTSFTLYANGRRILRSGRVSQREEDSRPFYGPTISTFDASGELDVIVHVANFEHRVGGIHNPIIFGLGDSVIVKKGIKIFLIFFLAGCFIIMGFYHAVVFLIIKNDNAPIWFAFFCLIICLRLLVTSEYVLTLFVDINWNAIIRTEYLTLYLGILSFMGFFKSLFNLYTNDKVDKIIFGVLGLFTLGVLVLKPFLFTQMLIIGQIFILSTSIYWYVILFRARRNGNSEALIFILGFTVIFLTGFNDILSSNEIIQTPSMIFYGTFLFIAVQAFLLSRRYSLATKRNEVLLNRLNEVNKNLEIKVHERTGELENQKEDLEESNAQILVQNEALKKLNIQMDNFVYSVSHDLKAPLASAIGLINLAKTEDDVTTLKHYFDMMEKSLNKLHRFINEILDFSRNARLELNKDEIDFKEIIEGTLEQYQFYEDWQEIEKIVEIDQKGTFISDHQRINIVINNLLSNALKYSTLGSNGAKVTIEVKTDSDKATLKISDTGCGIDNQHLEHIFNMFYRADTKKSGSGLGLYIVRETLEKLEGEIDIQSKTGKGTTVNVQIPNMQA